MIIDEIALLRKKLEMEITEQCSYRQIYNTSTEIDKLLVEYYKQKKLVEKL